MSLRRQAVDYWPALLDLLAATLMVFLMVTYIQDLLSTQDLEAFLIRQQQEEFEGLFRKELASEVAAGTVKIRPEHNALVVTFSDRVLFTSGDYRLLSEGESLLERCREIFVKADDIGYQLVQIEGHTDSLPLRRAQYPANNWQLSAARAIRVVELLASDSRLDAGRLSANGYADHRPVATNLDEVGRALNRRIEMRIFFSGKESVALPAEDPL